jgi:hypothetical protein
LLLVVGESEDAFDVSRAPTESIGELCGHGALVAPAQQSALKRAKPLCLWGPAPRKTCEGKHSLDVVGAAVETSTNFARNNSCRCEPADATFQRSKIREVIHLFAP